MITEGTKGENKGHVREGNISLESKIADHMTEQRILLRKTEVEKQKYITREHISAGNT